MVPKIFFYTAEPERFREEITYTLSLAAYNTYQFQTVYCIDQLKQSLFNEIDSAPILVLTAMTNQELDDLLEIKELYEDLPIILVIADESKETLRKAHLIQPEFLTTIEYDYVCVLSVIEHIAKLKEMTSLGNTGNSSHYSSCTVKDQLPN